MFPPSRMACLTVTTGVKGDPVFVRGWGDPYGFQPGLVFVCGSRFFGSPLTPVVLLRTGHTGGREHGAGVCGALRARFGFRLWLNVLVCKVFHVSSWYC